MKLADFDYTLPKELIAQRPLPARDQCRLMVLDRTRTAVTHHAFSDVVDYLAPGDCLVLNNTKVIAARLFGKRATGGSVEIFLLEKREPVCAALVRPAARIKEGERIALESGDVVEVLGRAAIGRLVKFTAPLDKILANAGHVPLPPYIGRDDEASDAEEYQTVYAAVEGATASPTAGLHFTKELLAAINRRGVKIVFVTLHTNYGTFAPVKTDDLTKHTMHAEWFSLPAPAAAVINETKKRGGRIVAVGTTATRVLEHCAAPDGTVTAQEGQTRLFIYPGYRFNIVDRLITNFHLPKSTLLLLVSAFAGKEFIFDAYRQAVGAGYRFFSYGDAMIII